MGLYARALMALTRSEAAVPLVQGDKRPHADYRERTEREFRAFHLTPT